jgi:hypothetical protein
MKLKLVSLKQIADKLKQNPVMSDMGWEFIVTHAVECLSIVGTPAIYVNKTVDVEVKDFRALLPVDLMGLESVLKVENNNLVPMSTSEDVLHDSYAGLKNLASTTGGFTYTTSHSALFTNFESGVIVIAYKTLATDEECFPLIPGQPELVRAVESYIRYKWYDMLNDLDQMSAQKLNKVETEYAWNVGQAQSALKMPNVDEMEALVNSITQILPERKQHGQRFQYLGAMEQLKIQVPY